MFFKHCKDVTNNETQRTYAAEDAIKGLEADHVVVVSFDGNFSKQELYVSASRARRTLTIIAPPQTGQLLDLA